MRAGFIGLGAMGAHMARNLAQQGWLGAVWNRTQATAQALAGELGVACAASPAQLAATVDAVLICVSADADVLAMIDALLPGLRPGTLVIDLSTVGSATAREAARRVRERGADFLDAPVTGGVEGARNATLAIMVGGAADTLERARPLLAAMGNRVVHMGDTGMGQATKAVNQVMCAGINQAVTEALAFGERLGLDMGKLIEVVSGGAAGNWFLEKRGPTLTQDVFRPGFKLALHHKDLKICEAMAEDLGTALPLSTATRQDYERLMAAGHGEEDISALYRLKRPAR
ncbi:NAD(P)-dependent oxidoreductase [Methylomagnum ishizawai]|uniref:NAD(P)-dependent oxidoreductase n=1 Tax=Methylomagnum ishizawai TaxID=1760988 RepID=UPI001C32A4AF|nr:NAD(P)-dependent oxidoreductase [Methylomagnum ishizawai]BBL74329.1 tartronate semialdehyde reductase [Methylomagnum ishizawai]